MAEMLFRHIMKDKPLLVRVRSAGMAAVDGAAVAPQVLSVLREKRVHNDHRAQRLNQESLDWADLILTMTEAHKNHVLQMVDHENVFTLREYVGDRGDIRDPFGGDVREYEKCAEELESLLFVLSEKIGKDSDF